MLSAIPLMGSIPQWGLLAVVSIAALRMLLPWKQSSILSLESLCNTLTEKVDNLSDSLERCEETCRRRDETILGMKKQNVAQQIGFARILMKALGKANPELVNMLKTLEGLEKSLDEPVLLGGEDEVRN